MSAPTPDEMRVLLGYTEEEWAAINRPLLRVWVDELRNGDQAQTTGYLKVIESDVETNPAGRCCLGVACDLFADEAGLEVEAYVSALGVTVGEWKDPVAGGVTGDTGELPSAIGEQILRLAHDQTNPRVWTLGHDIAGYPVSRVSELNDDHGWGFPRIADAVEATFLTGQEGAA